jgi:multidrug efflux pump subunit AcrA (membrane-fusion protein)
MNSAPRITLSSLNFTGTDKMPAGVSFAPGLNVLWGASNTGKSFTVKTVDFLLGGGSALPEITERDGYDRAWLALTLPKFGNATFMRSLAGGAFELLPAHILEADPKRKDRRKLSAKHNAAKPDNMSQFLLNELGLSGRSIAEDVYGKKRSLSFRDLVRYCLIDEAAIQSETSPVESGQVIGTTEEHSVLKLMLTGQDDSAIVTVTDKKTFTTSTTAKIEMIDELLKAVNDELEADFPDADGLEDQNEKLEQSWAEAQNEAQAAQESLRERLQIKNRLARETYQATQRQGEIQLNYGRFEQLEDVYASDIKRLESIEEAGFLLSLSGNQPCPLCGASPEDQAHSHGMDDIRRARAGADAEIGKIKKQRSELGITIQSLDSEGLQIGKSLEELEAELQRVETDISRIAPSATASKKRLDEVLEVRDHVKRGLELLQQRQSLTDRKDELTKAKPLTKADRPTLGTPGNVMDDFAQTVSKVLTEWQFPGQRRVSFDDGAYDLRIDGKRRRDNGKGVRAVTHSAFKVALLMFCRERNLPHPGFIILDTPLLTYRDPLRAKAGPLAQDEQELRNTSLKDFFFEHLSEVSKLGQIIVVENVDLPSNIEALGNVETFTGDPTNGRFGLFPRPLDPSRA